MLACSKKNHWKREKYLVMPNPIYLLILLFSRNFRYYQLVLPTNGPLSEYFFLRGSRFRIHEKMLVPDPLKNLIQIQRNTGNSQDKGFIQSLSCFSLDFRSGRAEVKRESKLDTFSCLTGGNSCSTNQIVSRVGPDSALSSNYFNNMP